MRKRIVYAQNFLRNKQLVSALINKSSISEKDTVYEIGAGQGIITEELLKKAGNVVAFEIDKNLYNKLALRYKNEAKLRLKFGDFMVYPLPNTPYKVFSNIPFNLTSSIVKKLSQTNPPEDTYLFVQKDAAKKFVGQPFDDKNSQLSILLKPFFEISVFYKFKKSDFFPKPRVDAVLLRILKRNVPLVSFTLKREYEDFIVYSFNQFKPNVVEGLSKIIGKNQMLQLSEQHNFLSSAKPSELKFVNWLQLFDFFSKNSGSGQKAIVEGSSARLNKQQQTIKKIHRTRVDKNWTKY